METKTKKSCAQADWPYTQAAASPDVAVRGCLAQSQRAETALHTMAVC